MSKTDIKFLFTNYVLFDNYFTEKNFIKKKKESVILINYNLMEIENFPK